ncbi:ABC-type multidrug transport system fused ATPase/permease subunit [Dysgonomonas hofstadii]|uniref:ABC-type multidrug transport system fused ATPase/permease subunit n=1 Tax=Dysgonomonas hofstadii TaxID=637886 RepID=A0A840CUV0_9BACT|nr:ABC transporter ATP-binding protein [Dysgonomonas hofstadii]MBB4036615.1 ABC-type multidrug transport system fused ATPase/permease subunit [Dysgonomonas hofstadii]
MNLRQHIHWLWDASKEVRSSMLLSSIIGVLRVCVSLLFVWVCKQLIDIASHTIDGNILHNAVLLVIVVIIELSLLAWSHRLENGNDIRLKNKLRHTLFSHVMLSSWDGKEHFHSGDVINRMEEDVRQVSETLCKTLPSVIVVCFQMVTAFLFLIRLDARMGWVMAFIMPVFLLFSKFYMKRMRSLTKKIRTTDSQAQSHIQEKIQHKVLIQTLVQNKVVTDKLSFFQNILYGQTLKRINFTLFSRTLVMAGFATGYVTAFLWGVNGIYEGTVSFGVMTAFLQLVGQVQRPMVDLSHYVPFLAQSLTSVEQLKELSDIPLDEQGEQQVLNKNIGIRFDNVSFCYPNDHREVISDFSFDFVPGSRTAIVGETGTGKSTLIRLILALLHPQKGQIYLYNEKQKAKVSSLTRRNMIYVPQGNTLLSGTIRDNLLLGNPTATKEQIEKVLQTAAAEFVYDLPDELNTICGERGAGLSEGQAQRICIARGLLRPGSILLLDEFSSSLDKETEQKLIEQLLSKTKGKTLIFITHREMVTKYCEQVIKLEWKGK